MTMNDGKRMSVPMKPMKPANHQQQNNNNNGCLDMLHSKRRMDWTRDWLKNHNNQFHQCDDLLPEKRSNEIYHFNNFFKMSEDQFKFLVQKLSSQITQQEPQRKKKAFSAEERLAVTLKYLATGEVHTCKPYGFRATQNVILTMIADICMKIYENLKDQYMKFPTSKEEWQDIAKGFYEKCKLPNCVGALEGKHITFKPQKITNHVRNNRFYDENSLVLMAIVDSNSNFVFVDVGERSQLNDRDIFNRSLLKRSLENEAISLPKDDKLPNSEITMQSFLVGNQSFPLAPYLMKQFYVSQLTEKQLFFDFRLWDVSQKAERCFEMLTNTFPILMSPFKLDAESAKKITLGCMVLHNWLRKTSSFDFYESHQSIGLENGEDQKPKQEQEEEEEEEEEDEDEEMECFQKTDCFIDFRLQGSDEESGKNVRNLLMDYVVANRHVDI